MPRPRARSRPLVALALVSASALATAVLAGCGGDDEAPVRARDGRIALTLTEYRFSPQSVVSGRRRVTLEIVNAGRLAHNVELTREGRTWLKVPTLRPGARATIRRRLPRGGYRVLCDLSNHEVLGMYGTLQVL